MPAPRGFEQVSGLRPGQHGAWVYADQPELARVVTDFLAEGRRRGEELVLLGTADRAALLGLLDGLGDRDALLRARQLRVARLGRPEGPFVLADPEDQVAAVAAGVEGALRRGWSGQRVAVLNSEVGTWSPEQRRLLAAYEQAVDALFDRLPLTALCLYPAVARRRLGPVLVLHPLQHPGSLRTPVPQIHVRVRAGAYALAGELDMAVADEVEQVLCAAGERLPSDEVCVDLRELDFLDLQGARALARAGVRLAAGGKQLTVTGARPYAERCLRLVGLTPSAG